MKISRLSRVAISLVSAGWVAPLWFAATMYALYVTTELLPHLRGEVPLNSFPHLQAATALVHLGLGWLGLAIAGWSYWALSGTRESSRA